MRKVLFLAMLFFVACAGSRDGLMLGQDVVDSADNAPLFDIRSDNKVDDYVEDEGIGEVKDNSSNDGRGGEVESDNDTGGDIGCEEGNCDGSCAKLQNISFCMCKSDAVSRDGRCLVSKARILFDGGHGVTSGNADWKIDDDYPRPQPPDPKRETDWDGGISRWAYELYKTGKYEIFNSGPHWEISYGTDGELDLSKYDIFVTVEPNQPFNEAEKEALIRYVKNGGRVIFVIDHRHSDRDRDGWDSPQVAHDLFVNNGIQKDPFGFEIPDNGEGVNISGRFSLMDTGDLIIDGPEGEVHQIAFHAGSYFGIARLKGALPLIWYGHYKDDTKVVAGISRYGKGWFALIGDSAIVDDGTSSAHDKLYDGWDEVDNGKFLMNLTEFMRRALIK